MVLIFGWRSLPFYTGSKHACASSRVVPPEHVQYPPVLVAY
jgi:hypothetical protein